MLFYELYFWLKRLNKFWKIINFLYGDLHIWLAYVILMIFFFLLRKPYFHLFYYSHITLNLQFQILKNNILILILIKLFETLLLKNLCFKFLPFNSNFLNFSFCTEKFHSYRYLIFVEHFQLWIWIWVCFIYFLFKSFLLY